MWLFFRIRRTVLVVALTGLFVVSAKAQITSDFASNAEGWTAPNTLAGIAYSSTGGNPSGYVSAVSYNYVLGAGTVSLPLFFVAPSKFSGNFSGYLNGTLRYDLQQSSTAGSELIQAEAILSNGTTTLYYYPPIPFAPAVAPTWTTFAIPLNEDSGYWRTSDSNTGAAATNAQILSVLTNLTSLQIKGRSRTSVNTGSLDNVGLTPPIIITTQPASTAVCEGANATLTTAATGNPVITYQWQKQSSSPVAVIWNNVANAGGYSGATSASLVVNTTGNFGAGNYRCKISAPNAIDEYTNNAVIGINPLPTAPTTTGNSSCTTGALTLTAAGGTNGQYRWYTAASGGTAITGQTNSTYSPALTGTTTYYVSINNGTCESTRTAVTGTINTPPNAPTTTGASSCSAATLTLTAAGGTNGQYRWYTVASGGTAITGQTNSTYSPALTGTTTYYVSINNGTCESTRTAVTGTINTPPNAPTTTGASSCSAATLTLTAAGGTNGQYRWYTVASGGTAITGQTNSTYSLALTGTTTYYVSINNGTCESTRTAVTGTINTPPNAPTTTGASSCSAASLTLTAAGGTNGQYRWYTVASGGTAITGQTNSTYSPALTGTTTYYVSINNGTCESTRTAVTGTINTPPNAPTTTGASSCSAATLTLTAAGGTNGQYRWYTVASGGTAITGQTNSTYSPALTGTTTYYVSINNGTCESTRTAVTGTINTPPNAPTTTGASSCSAATLTLTAAGGTNGQYRWYTVASGGTAITGQTNSTYSLALTGTTTYYVSINNGTCESTRTAVTGTINTPPNAPTTTGASSCSAASLTLTAAGGTNGQYRWYTVASGGIAITGQTNSTYSPALTGTTTYYVSINNGTCESTRTAVTGTINTPPNAPTTTGASSCSAATLTLTAAGGTNGQYRWYTVASGGTAITGQTSSTYSPALTGTTTYYVSINNGTCESTRTAVTGTINTPPNAPTTTGSSSCIAGTFTLAASGGANGQYQWYTLASGGTAIAGQTSSVYTTPVLTATTTYYVSIHNGTCESTRTAVTATVGTTLTPPSASGVSSCTAGPLTLTATGGTNGQYRWYLAATGGTAIAGQNSNTYTTPSLTSTTTYYVSLNNGSCESTRTPVTATIDTPPAAPTVTGNASCTASALTLTAAGGASGQYRWYTDASTGSPIAGELNATYTTPTLTSTTTYYVAVNNGTCESSRTAVVATIGCVANEAPVIAPTPITAPIEGKVTLNLAKLISDKEGNQDLTTLKVTVPPSSGATATIDPQYNLILDYTGISFSGTEKLTIQVCDQAGACAQRELSIDVIGDVQVYNALSPNNDGQNEFLFLQYIDVLEDTKKNKVSVFGRWGDLVFDIEDYNNTTKIFNGLNNSGHELPSGTYFYKIEFAGNRKPLTGYLTLKR